MASDLRSYISQLEEVLPQQYVVIEKEIDSRFEITALLRRLEKADKFPSVLFENVKAINGQSGKRVFTNVTADRRRIALALGLDPDKWRSELTAEFARRAEKLIEPVTVSRAEAPVKQVVKVGAGADLQDLPIIYHHEMDGNPYGTLLVLTKKPENIGYNLAYHRTMYKSPQQTGIHMSPFHSWKTFTDNEKKGLPTPVAIVHGHHPAFILAGVFMSPWPWDEYKVAGAFLGEPVRLVPSETWGEDLLVPADAEVIIEGEILPGVREPEGPFGEWSGYYGPQRQNPVIQVKAITHRQDYIWYDTDIGHLDHPGIGWEAEIYRRVNDVLPGSVRGVFCPYSGREGFHAYISIEKLSEGLPAIAASAAQTVGYPKLIVVVDDDIDPYDEREVLFAVATRFQADKDLTVLKNVRGSMLDPSMSHLTTHTSTFIDATKPIDEPFPLRVQVPQAALEKVKLEDYIPRERVDEIPYTSY